MLSFEKRKIGICMTSLLFPVLSENAGKKILQLWISDCMVRPSHLWWMEKRRDSWPKAQSFGSIGLQCCSNQYVYFLYSDALTSGALLNPEGPPVADQFLERVNNLSLNMPFKCRPLKPARTPQSPYLSSSHPGLPPTHPSHVPGSDTRQWGTVTMPQSLLNLLKVDNPKPVYPLLFLP